MSFAFSRKFQEHIRSKDICMFFMFYCVRVLAMTCEISKCQIFYVLLQIGIYDLFFFATTAWFSSNFTFIIYTKENYRPTKITQIKRTNCFQVKRNFWKHDKIESNILAPKYTSFPIVALHFAKQFLHFGSWWGQVFVSSITLFTQSSCGYTDA